MTETLLDLPLPEDPSAAGRRVVEVILHQPLPHLDRPFEYLLEPGQEAPVGCRVVVPFAGREHEGLVTAVKDSAEHVGRLSTVRRVVSPETVLVPQVLELARELAGACAATVSDVLRLAIPKRHARAEKALTERPLPAAELLPDSPTGPWARYPAGESLLARLQAGEPVRAEVLAAPPGGVLADDWPTLLATAVARTVHSGRGALVVVPDERDLARLDAAMSAALGQHRHVRLTAEMGPQARYTAWLSVLRGRVPVVIGTRAAAYAPVQHLGLVVWWDDGDDLHREPRSPYAPTRQVLAARSRIEDCALLVVGYGQTTALARWAADGAVPGCPSPFPVLTPERSELRARAGRTRLASETTTDPVAARARIPDAALALARRSLQEGPVLVQVPRAGYVPALTCQDCGQRARCPACHGPVAITGHQATPACRWCGRPAGTLSCSRCEGHQFRSVVRGAARTAEELGRTVPGTTVVLSGRDRVVTAVGAEPALVVATPGAEPVAESGYAGVLLLDAWALLDLPGLDAPEEALRRWLAAASLARVQAPVMLCGTPEERPAPVEALVRWDPVWLARRELDERAELSLPPAVRMARLRGERTAVAEGIAWFAEAMPEAEVLGPLELRVAPGPRAPEKPLVQALLRVPLDSGQELARQAKALRAVRSAVKKSELHVRMDPEVDLG